MFHQIENINREKEFTKMNYIEILEQKSTIINMKNSLEDSIADLNRQKKQLANLKINQMNLSSLRSKKKKKKKNE